jgi:hypothetical protein
MKILKQLIKEIILQESQFDCSKFNSHRGYYDLDVNNPFSIEDIAEAWSTCGIKPYENGTFHAYYAPNDLKKFREYKWSRQSAGGLEVTGRGGRTFQDKWHFIPDENENVGADKWDAMAQKLQNGWKPGSPAHVEIGKNKNNGITAVKVGEGNHRLAVALDLNLDIPIPVMFHFRENVQLSSDSNV